MQENVFYETKYSTIIEPLFGQTRSLMQDTYLLSNNVLPHQYTIIQEHRMDCTSQETYSIDPDGCQDADDAFSIYTDGSDNLILDIHIADPTEYINPFSDLWEDIVHRTITSYPSNRPPIHMMPEEIMEKSSLMENKYGDIKNAITIRTHINKETYKPIGKVQLLFSLIKVSKTNMLSYYQASEMADTHNVISIGLNISKALTEIRSQKTKGVKLNEVSNSYVKFSNDNTYFYLDNPNEIKIKQMIAEFAIFANSFVGEYLKIHLNGIGIFRVCDTNEWLNTVDENITGQELLNRIITDGIKADYLAENASHDLVGMPEYCHFTSPIRRLSDCVCHYLLKYIQLRNTMGDTFLFNTIPFSTRTLDSYAERCMHYTKKQKRNQYNDTKFRIIQTMNNMLLSNNPTIPLQITFFITKYTGLFLNIIVCKIDTHCVYMSYSLRTKTFNYNKIDTKYTIPITKVICPGKFDQGSIPELDDILLNNKLHTLSTTA